MFWLDVRVSQFIGEARGEPKDVAHRWTVPGRRKLRRRTGGPYPGTNRREPQPRAQQYVGTNTFPEHQHAQHQVVTTDMLAAHASGLLASESQNSLRSFGELSASGLRGELWAAKFTADNLTCLNVHVELRLSGGVAASKRNQGYIADSGRRELFGRDTTRLGMFQRFCNQRFMRHMDDGFSQRRSSLAAGQ